MDILKPHSKITSETDADSIVTGLAESIQVLDAETGENPLSTAWDLAHSLVLQSYKFYGLSEAMFTASNLSSTEAYSCSALVPPPADCVYR